MFLLVFPEQWGFVVALHLSSAAPLATDTLKAASLAFGVQWHVFMPRIVGLLVLQSCDRLDVLLASWVCSAVCFFPERGRHDRGGILIYVAIELAMISRRQPRYLSSGI